MLVMTLENVPPGLRGYLARWLVEAQTGVYVGRTTARVRDLLWRRALERAAGGRVMQAWTAQNEQGFEYRIAGDDRRELLDFDGITLVVVKPARTKAE
jgi:CRISPR-associated protein Cas2